MSTPTQGGRGGGRSTEALLRATTYLKWIRDQAVMPEAEPPDDIGQIITALEELATELQSDTEVA